MVRPHPSPEALQQTENCGAMKLHWRVGQQGRKKKVQTFVCSCLPVMNSSGRIHPGSLCKYTARRCFPAHLPPMQKHSRLVYAAGFSCEASLSDSQHNPTHPSRSAPRVPGERARFTSGPFSVPSGRFLRPPLPLRTGRGERGQLRLASSSASGGARGRSPPAAGTGPAPLPAPGRLSLIHI